MKCGSCDYDMSATPDAAACPECGSTTWRHSKARLSVAQQWNIGLSCVPLGWLVILHVVILGREAFPKLVSSGVEDLFKAVAFGSVPLAFIANVGVVWYMLADDGQTGRHRGVTGFLVALGLWTVAILWVSWNPACVVPFAG